MHAVDAPFPVYSSVVAFTVLLVVYLRVSKRENVGFFAMIFGFRQIRLKTSERFTVGLIVVFWLVSTYFATTSTI